MASKVNIQNFLRSLNQEFLPQARAVMKQATYEFASAVLTDAKEICPIKTGFLVASGSVSAPVDEGGKIRVTIGFNASYAAAVHEITTNVHASGKQAKFLETPMRERAPEFAPYVLKRLQEEFA